MNPPPTSLPITSFKFFNGFICCKVFSFTLGGNLIWHLLKTLPQSTWSTSLKSYINVCHIVDRYIFHQLSDSKQVQNHWFTSWILSYCKNSHIAVIPLRILYSITLIPLQCIRLFLLLLTWKQQSCPLPAEKSSLTDWRFSPPVQFDVLSKQLWVFFHPDLLNTYSEHF